MCILHSPLGWSYLKSNGSCDDNLGDAEHGCLGNMNKFKTNVHNVRRMEQRLTFKVRVSPFSLNPSVCTNHLFFLNDFLFHRITHFYH